MKALTRSMFIYIAGLILLSFIMSYKPTAQINHTVDDCARYPTECQSRQE